MGAAAARPRLTVARALGPRRPRRPAAVHCERESDNVNADVRFIEPLKASRCGFPRIASFLINLISTHDWRPPVEKRRRAQKEISGVRHITHKRRFPFFYSPRSRRSKEMIGKLSPESAKRSDEAFSCGYFVSLRLVPFFSLSPALYLYIISFF